MTNVYLELKKKHQQEVNDFPMFFAFNNDQFKEGMERFGLTVDDTDQIYSFGMGGFYRRTDAADLREMFDRHEREKKEAIDNDETGDGYCFHMFNYELGNHEFGYTREIEPTLEALGLEWEDVRENEKLLYALKKAIAAHDEEDA